MESFVNPVNGVITSLYGYRINPVLKTQEFHNGIDIYEEVGTDVVAVWDGEVTEVRNSKSYGNVLKYRILNNSKYKSADVEVFYAHLDKVLVSVGDKIKKGEVVAKSGETGLVTGPHLHYTVLVDGKTINPISFLSSKWLFNVNGRRRWWKSI